MYSNTLGADSSPSQRLDKEEIDGSTNPWYFYFHADQAKAKGKANNQSVFSIKRKDIETIWAENIASPDDVIAGFKIKPKVFAKSLVDSSNDPDPIVLYNTHNYNWILYDGQFEVQKIRLTENKLKIHTTALLPAKDSDLSLAENEAIKLPSAAFTFPIIDLNDNYFKQLNKEFEQKKYVKDKITGAKNFVGPITSSSPCVTLECDSCYSEDDDWMHYADRTSEITDDNIRTSICSLGRTFNDDGPDGEPLKIIGGAINAAIKGNLNCKDCPCGCSVPGYCD